ncbi:MAG: DUF4349 domain-containing protein [Pseudomonadota bacterium]
MRRTVFLTGSAALALAGCSSENQAMYESTDAMGVDAEIAIEAAADADMGAPEQASETAPVGQPQIAYRYALGFRLPADAIKPLQEKHADMCEARGPDVCRIISMSQSDSDGDYSYGNLQLAVAANTARAFSKELEGSSEPAGGELASSSITGEDLSKQIVDTEAKLRARTLLRDRLMDILRTRRGTVAELVEAERGVAQVNQEIDQARSWLTEMRGRVAYSQMAISYESGSPSGGGFMEPIRNAWGSLGAILGTTIAFIMMGAVVLVPIGLIVWLAARLWRWVRRKSPSATPSRNGAETTSEAVELPSAS